MPQVPLDRKSILQSAFWVLNEAGLEGLTLRKLATRLGVQAPAIYWHFKNKQELLDEMATQVMRDMLQDSPVVDPAQSWQSWAMEYCSRLRRILLSYRDGAKMFSGTYLTDTSLFASMDRSLSKLKSAGFDLHYSVISLGTLYSYTIGFVIEEQATKLPADDFGEGEPAQELDPRYELSHRSARIDADTYPLAHAAGAVMFAGDDSRFEAGLRIIVAGMAACLAASP
jgi:AcrR family transcriptional regulator